MKIDVLTLFPEVFPAYLEASIIGRAIEAGHLAVSLYDIRAYTEDKHRRADDYPFGGGAGMVMMAQPIVSCMRALEDAGFAGRRLYASPRGKRLDQQMVKELSKEREIAILAGHYEGVDERALTVCGFEEVSIGDYVLTGGELPSLVIIDAIARLIPGVIADMSPIDESFSASLLEYAQYTRPREFEGLLVPDVLLNGDHKKIEQYRREDMLARTQKNRPDLLLHAELTKKDREFLHKTQFTLE